jgi:hypothetical protein
MLAVIARYASAEIEIVTIAAAMPHSVLSAASSMTVYL